jgi:hypothetical protein
MQQLLNCSHTGSGGSSSTSGVAPFMLPCLPVSSGGLVYVTLKLAGTEGV